MMKRGLVLVEGQTEEHFVKEVLSPHCTDLGLALEVTILTTKRVKAGPNFKGGITSFRKFERDLTQLIRGAGGNGLVTTIIDYYGLPDDFPGMSNRPASAKSVQLVEHVESALRDHFTYQHFLPFLSLHEFEAWLFSSPEIIYGSVPGADPGTIEKLRAVRRQYNCPEDINDHPGSNPSTRLAQVFPQFRKVVHGSTAIKRIGLDGIRRECPHFDQWVTKLENYAQRSR